MVFDLFHNSSSVHAPSNLPKKKRGNKSAKLKRCKLDARRQQWLSQVNSAVKNKGGKGELNGGGKMDVPIGKDQAVGVLGSTLTIIEGDGSVNNHRNSSHIGQFEGSNCIVTNVGGSSSSNVGTSYSGSLSEGEENGCLDDWEAFADVMAASGDKQENHTHKMESPEENTNITLLSPSPQVMNQRSFGKEVFKPKQVNNKAWRPHTFRPQSRPNLVKQKSFPMRSTRHYDHGRTAWVCKKSISAPSCPICCEDLDITDLSFFPCSCGFQLCLFCHKRILDDDGRCPGCRKHYENDTVKGERKSDLSGDRAVQRLGRSCSMITRS